MEPKEPLGPPELPKGTKFQPLTSVQLKVPSAEDGLEDDAEEDHLNEHVENPGDPDGVIEAEQQREWRMKQAKAEAKAVAAAERPPKKRSKARWLLFPLVLLLVGAATYGAYWLGNNQADKNRQTTKQTHTQSTQQHTQQSTQNATTTVPTKHYDSTTYTMGLDYPQDWTVSDTSAKLAVVSPKLSLTTATGTTVDGHVVVTIQNPQTNIAGYPANGATATRTSDKLTYKQPTPVQRAQTYLTYLGYGKANALDSLYVTGDNGYQKGQNVPLSDVTKGNPLISVTFQSCTSADCSTGTPTMLTLSNDFWTDLPANRQANDLIKSIQLS